MARSSRALIFIAMAVLASVLGTAHGASYTVGAPGGSWDLQTNYDNWASRVTFRAGDVLVFKYARGTHDVVEVNKADYDSCSGSSPIKSFQTGDDTVPLPDGGVTRYFICSVPRHCDGGMKLAVAVEDAEAAAAPGPNDAAAPSSPRRAGPPMATPSADAPSASRGQPAAPPPSSAAASSSAGGVASLALVAVMAAALVAI